MRDEGHGRTRRTAQVARTRPPCGRAAQYDSNSRQCAGAGGSCQARVQGHRPRPRSHRIDRRRGRARRRDHGAGPHVLRDRAQAPGGRAGRARSHGRPRHARDPRRSFALHAADAAGERFSRPRCGRDDPQLQARGRRPQAPHRQDPVRDLDRGDALLPQRHLSAHRRQRQSADAARGRHRRPCQASSCPARPWAKCSA